MKFRQRLAWLAALVYLGSSFFVLYYLFEISEHYNKFALEHVNTVHKDGQSGEKSKIKGQGHSEVEGHKERSRILPWQHIADIPLALWFVILLVPYLQIFFMILACTKAEPRMSIAFLWPGMIYIKYQEVVQQLCNRNKLHIKSSEYANGHTILHT